MPHERLRPSFVFDEEKLKQLQQIAPEAFADGKINLDVLRESLGERLEEGAEAEHFGLFWPRKRDARKIASIPSKGALIPVAEDGVDEDATQNIFIDGDNLEVLKLLQKSYVEKIKMIYIDPPYNTGNDFIYDDKFTQSLEEYLNITGQTDEEGKALTTNKRGDGRFHSKWLSMMYPRLFLSRSLLREDGIIFISIDDNEVNNLRSVCDECFGEHNFIGCICWNSTKSVTNTALISVSHNYNLVYAKDIEYFIKNRVHFRLPESGEGFENPDNDPRGPWKADPFQVGGWRPNQQYKITNPKTGEVYKPNSGCSWKNDYDKFQELQKDNRIVFGVSGEAGPQRKRFLSEALERGQVTKTWWDDVGTTTNGTQELKKIFDNKIIFDNPKPVDLIRRMIMLGDYTKEGIILDFFSGSATTAHAVLELNKDEKRSNKFIMVQLTEPCEKDSEAYKMGLKNISEIGKERIRRVIKKLRKESKKDTSQDFGFKVFKLDKSNFKQWQNYDGSDVNQLKDLFEKQGEPLVDGWKPENLLVEVMLQEGFPLDSDVVGLKDLKKNKVMQINSSFCQHKLLISFDKKIAQDTIDELKIQGEDIFVCLDSALTDEQKVTLSDKGFLKTI